MSVPWTGAEALTSFWGAHAQALASTAAQATVAILPAMYWAFGSEDRAEPRFVDLVHQGR
jgi:hypothetical protein